MKKLTTQLDLAIEADDRSAFEDCELFPAFIQENRTNLGTMKLTIRLDKAVLRSNLLRNLNRIPERLN